MCQRVNCKQCGKPSWSGCGAHVEQVLGDVPMSDRCQCGAKGASRSEPAAAGAKRRWFRR